MTRIALNPPRTNSSWSGDGRPSLLIADDDPVLRSALSYQLAGNFRVVGVAKDAEEAAALAQTHQPDIVLLDVEMPGGGAPVAVPQIAMCSPRTSIVILSGDESHRIVLELLNAGAVAYLRKGVSATGLTQTLADALKVKGDSRPV
jgi:DNA-binding NarL/FixJ family response regulator